MISAQDRTCFDAFMDKSRQQLKGIKMASTVKHAYENGTEFPIKNTRSKNTEPSKAEWIQQHAERIHTLWFQWQTPLGIAYKYVEQIKKDLEKFYDDPLKRNFIEVTYC